MNFLWDLSSSHYQVSNETLFKSMPFYSWLFLSFPAPGVNLPENRCVSEDAGTLVISVERYGDLTLTSMVDVVTVDTDPVEAEGESTLLTCQNKLNLLFFILQLMLIIFPLGPLLLSVVEEGWNH